MTGLRLTQFLAIVALAITLVPAGAHLFEMRAKLALPAETYMQVQGLYAGWAFFGIAIYLAMFLLLVLVWMHRHDAGAVVLTIVALLLIAGSQGIFWAYTQPMNVATQNWTTLPSNLAAARTQWEYSHAINAVMTFVAFLAATAAILRTTSRRF